MNSPEADAKIIGKWQSVVNTMAELLQVPAGLIMRINGTDIEVFVSSDTPGNPYHPGDKDHLIDSGLYCETVIKTQGKLHIPNALADKDWDHNPDIKLGMISYLGFPIILPTGAVFGTICVLDNKENHFNETYEQLVLQFKELIESQLILIHHNRVLAEMNEELTERLAEIKTLRGILPICSYCRRIRDDDGYWQAVEVYIQKHTEAELSHGICLDCMQEHFPEAYRKKLSKQATPA